MTQPQLFESNSVQQAGTMSPDLSALARIHAFGISDAMRSTGVSPIAFAASQGSQVHPELTTIATTRPRNPGRVGTEIFPVGTATQTLTYLYRVMNSEEGYNVDSVNDSLGPVSEVNKIDFTSSLLSRTVKGFGLGYKLPRSAQVELGFDLRASYTTNLTDLLMRKREARQVTAAFADANFTADENLFDESADPWDADPTIEVVKIICEYLANPFLTMRPNYAVMNERTFAMLKSHASVRTTYRGDSAGGVLSQSELASVFMLDGIFIGMDKVASSLASNATYSYVVPDGEILFFYRSPGIPTPDALSTTFGLTVPWGDSASNLTVLEDFYQSHGLLGCDQITARYAEDTLLLDARCGLKITGVLS